LPLNIKKNNTLTSPNDTILAIDWGNTRIKLAIFDKKSREELAFLSKKTLSINFLNDLCTNFKVKSSILCSVVHHTVEIVDFLTQKTDFTLLSHDMNLPIALKYSTPHTLGCDRIAAVCGAWAHFPNQNNLVIDAGTCIKYDFVTENGDYLGGTISPGIGMRFRAMHEFTAKLPLVQREKLTSFIGNTTETALRTGGQLGAAMEAQGFANLYKQNCEKSINIIVTGGDGTYLINYLENATYRRNLVIEGLLSLVF
jgi:type III pantothenate kinase